MLIPYMVAMLVLQEARAGGDELPRLNVGLLVPGAMRVRSSDSVPDDPSVVSVILDPYQGAPERVEVPVGDTAVVCEYTEDGVLRVSIPDVRLLPDVGQRPKQVSCSLAGVELRVGLISFMSSSVVLGPDGSYLFKRPTDGGCSALVWTPGPIAAQQRTGTMGLTCVVRDIDERGGGWVQACVDDTEPTDRDALDAAECVLYTQDQRPITVRVK